MEALKTACRYDLLLDDEEIELVHKLVGFLQPFKSPTDVVSDSNNALSVISLVSAAKLRSVRDSN